MSSDSVTDMQDLATTTLSCEPEQHVHATLTSPTHPSPSHQTQRHTQGQTNPTHTPHTDTFLKSGVVNVTSTFNTLLHNENMTTLAGAAYNEPCIRDSCLNMILNMPLVRLGLLRGMTSAVNATGLQWKHCLKSAGRPSLFGSSLGGAA